MVVAIVVPFFVFGGYDACRARLYKICAMNFLGRSALGTIFISGGVSLGQIIKVCWWIFVDRRELNNLRSSIIELLVWVVMIEVGLVMAAVFLLVS